MDYVTSRRMLIQQNGFAMSRTFGKSMRPLIWGGQHCVVVAPLYGEPAVGDLLMFKQALPDGKERNIVHRLTEIRKMTDKTLYITRGDNCLGSEKVYPEEIIGRVTEVHRVSGFRPWHIVPMKQFAVTDSAYLRYSRIWSAIWPVRRQYYIFRGHVRGLRSRLVTIFKRK